MRIAFISTMAAAPWGGSEELWSRTAFEAAVAGHTVFAGVYERKNLQERLQQLVSVGVAIHQRPIYNSSLAVRLYRRLKIVLGLVTPLEKAIAQFKPDLICVSQGGNFDLAYGPPLREFILGAGFAFCIICHNYNPNQHPTDEERKCVIKVYDKAQMIYFVSAEQAHVTQRQLARRFHNIKVVKNPVNVEGNAPEPWPDSDTTQLAIVAALHVDRKGQDLALEVLSQPHWLERSWHLNLYGGGPDEQYIRDLAAMYNLTDRISLHGMVMDIGAVWRQNQLLLLPSRLEAAPLVIMEAMLCGRPVVATAVGTVPEWVKPAETGFIAPAATVKLFEIALEEAWQERHRWQTMGTQAYEWACSHGDTAAATNFLNELHVLNEVNIDAKRE